MANVTKFLSVRFSVSVMVAALSVVVVPAVNAQWISGGGGAILYNGSVGVNTNPLAYGGSPFVLYSATLPYFIINSGCAGNGCDPSFALMLNGASPKAYVGVVAGNDNGVLGSLVGDMYIRSQNARLLFSVDGGVTQAITVASGGVNMRGTVTADNIVAKYQDLAEWVPADENLEPGTVVVIDVSANNRVRRSAKSYDTGVAGVVSEKPGVILGEPGDSKEMIATTGRVRVKVDASVSPVSVGDLLVSSPLAGYAMVSKPMDINGAAFHRPATIIGKALEPLASGRGEILVLLSLQ